MCFMLCIMLAVGKLFLLNECDDDEGQLRSSKTMDGKIGKVRVKDKDEHYGYVSLRV